MANITSNGLKKDTSTKVFFFFFSFSSFQNHVLLSPKKKPSRSALSLSSCPQYTTDKALEFSRDEESEAQNKQIRVPQW